MVRALRSVVAAMVLVVVGLGTAARALTFVPAGDSLRITFTESGAPRVGGGAITGAGGRFVDTLEFIESNHLSNNPHGTAKLYNGTTLLGSMNFNAQGVQTFTFVAPGSLWTFGEIGTVNDWNSIEGGTINGILDITLDQDADLNIFLTALGVANGSGSILTANVTPVITRVSVVHAVAATPLPGALPLFVGGLGLLGVVTRSRRRKASSAPAGRC